MFWRLSTATTPHIYYAPFPQVQGSAHQQHGIPGDTILSSEHKGTPPAMAEIVGLISAVGAIVGAVFKITQAITELCDGFETAPDSIKSIADDTRILTTLLLGIQTRLERD